MIRKYRELTRLEMEQVDKEETIVLIPVGALEQHGNQAPLGTDDIIAEAMVEYLGKALEEAGEADFPILAFPVIPVGLSTEHKNFCGSITLKPDTYYHLLYDISESLYRHGFRKIAFLVCHGGNLPVIQILAVSFGVNLECPRLFCHREHLDIRMYRQQYQKAIITIFMEEKWRHPW